MNHFLKGENRNSGTNRTRPYEANVIISSHTSLMC